MKLGTIGRIAACTLIVAVTAFTPRVSADESYVVSDPSAWFSQAWSAVHSIVSAKIAPLIPGETTEAVGSTDAKPDETMQDATPLDEPGGDDPQDEMGGSIEPFG